MAFGKYHRPGFSTYPQPWRFDDIYEELAKHKQVAWASSEGTNLQLGAGPGQSGMTMETYLAKMFNHGATLVNVYSWGIGGEANRNMSFRVVTEGEEALRAYRKFLKGEPLIEAKTDALTLLERLPPKIHKIQKEFPAWMQKTANPEAAALMQQLEEQVKNRNFEEAEKTADSILKLMGASAQPAIRAEAVSLQVPEEVRKLMRHKLDSSFVVFRDKVQEELKLSKEQVRTLEAVLPDAMQFLQRIEGLKPEEQEREIRAYRPMAHDRLAAVVRETLSEDQRTRLRQIELQRDQLFGGEIWRELHVTDEQQKQFMVLIQKTQNQIKTLMEEIEKGGNPEEIRTKVLTSRAALEGQLESLLTDSQRKQWKAMLGKPMDLRDIFDM